MTSTAYQLWSTLRLPAHVVACNTTRRLFTIPLGQQGQGFERALDTSLTNVREGGRVPFYEGRYEVEAVSWFIFGGTQEYRDEVAAFTSWGWDHTTLFYDGTPLSEGLPCNIAVPCIREPVTIENVAACDARPGVEAREEVEVEWMSLVEALRDRGGRYGWHVYSLPHQLSTSAMFAVMLRTGSLLGAPPADTFVRFVLHGRWVVPAVETRAGG